jgi:hypothetical protein
MGSLSARLPIGAGYEVEKAAVEPRLSLSRLSTGWDTLGIALT